MSSLSNAEVQNEKWHSKFHPTIVLPNAVGHERTKKKSCLAGPALERRIEASAANVGVADFAGAAVVPAHRFRETHQERTQVHRALLSSARRS